MTNRVPRRYRASAKSLQETFIAPEQTQKEALAIATQIDQLRFLLGYHYDYKVTLPALRFANFDTIYLQKSIVERIARVGQKDTAPREQKTLYIKKVVEDNVTFSYYRQPEKNDKEAQQAQEFTIRLTKELVMLLPEENNDSTEFTCNPTLLREVILRIGEQLNHENPVVLLCSVKHYDGSYKTIRATAQQLEFARLAKKYHLKHATETNNGALHNWIKKQSEHATLINMPHPDNIDNDTFNVIIDMMEEKGYANRGLKGLDPNEQILPNEYESDKRKKSALLLKTALLMELVFTYLQFTASYAGWYSLLRIGSVCFTLSFIGASFDLVNNLWGILVDNDAIALSLQNTNAHMNLSMQRIASIAYIANDISFLVGGAGNGLGLLFILNKYMYNKAPTAFYCIGSVIIAIMAYVGREYYLAFNNKYLVASLNSFAEYLNAKKVDHDRFYERDIAIAISALPVIVFRSVGFGGIAVLLALAFHINNGWVNLFIGLGATFITVISVIATRIKAIVEHWSNNKFAYLSPEEKAKAWNEFDYNKIQNTLLSFNTLESIAVALGLLCLTKFNPGVDSCIAAMIGAFIVTIMCRAQILRQINCDALAKLEQAGIDVKERARLADNHQPTINPMQLFAADNVVYLAMNGEEVKADDSEYNPNIDADKNDKFMRKIHAATLIFEAMKRPYLECFWGSSVLAISSFVVGVSVMSRGLGFLGYVDICNSILTPLTTIPLNHTLQIIGLALIFAFSNVRNMFGMYSENMSDHIAQKMVEREIYLSNNTTDDSESTCVKYWQFFTQVNPCSSSGLRRKASELTTHLEKRIEENEKRSKLYNHDTISCNL